MRTKSGLTPRQEKFARAFVQTGNATEAYRRAYKTDGWTTNALWVAAHRLRVHAKVSLRIEQMQKKAAEKHDITVEKLTEMAKAAYDLAMSESVSQPSAATGAVVALAKLHGLIVERRHNVNETVTDADDLSDADLAAIAAGSSKPAADEAESAPGSDRLH